jgi:predicted CXXCH cytochrome family protein
MQENGRQRAAKIDRSYHASFDRFIHRKRWMGFLGLVLGLIYSAWMFSSKGALHVSTGDLSQPHFAWNKTGCEQCHISYVPIRKDAWSGGDTHNIALNNQKCNGQCHSVTGHFELQTKGEVVASESCSTCHREHLGFARSLVDVADTDCVRCHANMPAVALQSQRTKPVKNFSDTKDGHPAFASLKKDPGTIRFSHAQHMRPGQPKSPGGADAKKPEMISDQFRDRYNNVTENNLIQLQCSDCHERDIALKGYESLESLSKNEQESLPVAIQSSAHRLYQPVEFEKHCIACHDLDGVPHGLNLDQTRQAVNKMLPVETLEYLKNRNPKMDAEALTKQAMSKDYQEEIDGYIRRLETLLNNGTACLKCHQKSEDSKSIVAPSNIKKKWLQDASFTHGAHLMMRCQECHAGAYEKSDHVFDWEQNNFSENEASSVMISGIEKCRECHIQDPEERSRMFGTEKRVASADCVDCHRYHIDPPKKSGGEAASIRELHRYLVSEKTP